MALLGVDVKLAAVLPVECAARAASACVRVCRLVCVCECDLLAFFLESAFARLCFCGLVRTKV